MRPFAFVDVETTGADPSRHEVVEVSVIRVCATDLSVEGKRTVRIAPEHLERAEPGALKQCGYSEAAWSDASPLRVALGQVAPLLEGAVPAGHFVQFDRRFLTVAFTKAFLRQPTLDPRNLDTAQLAWPLFATGKLPSLSLETLCRALGVQYSRPCRAETEARSSFMVAKRLLNGLQLGATFIPEVAG